MKSFFSRNRKSYPDTINLDNLLKQLAPYTLCSPNRLTNLAKIASNLQSKLIPGDFVECGTYKGGTAALLSQYLHKDQHLWLYDSFQGMPPTTERDGSEAEKWVGKCLGNIQDVEEVMNIVKTPKSHYTIKKGWFETSFKDPLPTKVALLHCDADWYNSVSLVLDTFYPLISEGGYIVLDDFGYWEGCREAFYDFCFRQNISPLLERYGSTQAYWIKGKLNNR